MRIVVCVVTCRRPGGLARLLRALARVGASEDAALRVLVVDNDPERSAAPVVEDAARTLPWPVAHRHEPRRGVSFARNTALDATTDADLIAFIDDDETPGERWLEALVACHARTGAAAVTGPTRAVFEAGVPGWVRSAYALCYVRPKPGRPLEEFTTGNVLLSRRALAAHGLTFDESLALVGGEDTLLAAELVARGEILAWADDALVEEYIPRSRATLGWLLRRWYRTGNVEALLAMRRRRGVIGRARGLIGGAARIGLGLAALVPSPFWLARGLPDRSVRRLYTLARGLGMVACVCGRRHHEYRVLHGA